MRSDLASEQGLWQGGVCVARGLGRDSTRLVRMLAAELQARLAAWRAAVDALVSVESLENGSLDDV